MEIIFCPCTPIKLFKHYKSLVKSPSGQLWRRQVNRKFTEQLGKTFFQKLPKFIAEKLDLPNPQFFTGHAFHRTAATLQGEASATFQDLKKTI